MKSIIFISIFLIGSIFSYVLIDDATLANTNYPSFNEILNHGLRGYIENFMLGLNNSSLLADISTYYNNTYYYKYYYNTTSYSITAVANNVTAVSMLTSGAVGACTGITVALKCVPGAMVISNPVYTGGCLGLTGISLTFGGTFVQLFSSWWSNLSPEMAISISICLVTTAFFFCFTKMPANASTSTLGNIPTSDIASVAGSVAGSSVAASSAVDSLASLV